MMCYFPCVIPQIHPPIFSFIWIFVLIHLHIFLLIIHYQIKSFTHWHYILVQRFGSWFPLVHMIKYGSQFILCANHWLLLVYLRQEKTLEEEIAKMLAFGIYVDFRSTSQPQKVDICRPKLWAIFHNSKFSLKHVYLVFIWYLEIIEFQTRI